MEKHVLKLNNEAMNCLKNQMPDAAFSSLSKAESLLKTKGIPHSDRLWGITLNNLGCYHKKIGKQVMALHYYESALQMEINSTTDAVNMSGIYLNICSIKSQLSDHISAIEFAHRSLELLNPYIRDDPSVVHSLALTYHNLGVEYFYLGRTSEAVKYAQQGLSLALKHLDDHNIVELLREDVNNFTKPSKKYFVPSFAKGSSTPSRRALLTSSVHSSNKYRKFSPNDSQLNKDIYRVIPFVRKRLPLKKRLTPQKQYYKKDIELAEKRAEEALKELRALKKEKQSLAVRSGNNKRKVIPVIESLNNISINPEIQKDNKSKSDKDKKAYKPLVGNMYTRKKNDEGKELKINPRNKFVKDEDVKPRRNNEKKGNTDTFFTNMSEKPKRPRLTDKAAQVDPDFAKKNSLTYQNPDANFDTLSYDDEDIYVKSKSNEINDMKEKTISDYGTVNYGFNNEYLHSDDDSSEERKTKSKMINTAKWPNQKVSPKFQDKASMSFDKRNEQTQSPKHDSYTSFNKNSEIETPKNKGNPRLENNKEIPSSRKNPNLDKKNAVSNTPKIPNKINIDETNLPKVKETNRLHRKDETSEKPKNIRNPDSSKRNDTHGKPTQSAKKRDLHEYLEPLSPRSKESLNKFSNSVIPPWVHGAIWRKWIKKLKSSAIRLQSWTRSHQTSRLYRKIREAVIFIQTIYRDHRSRKNCSADSGHED